MSKLLNLDEACEFVGRSPQTIRKAIKNKEIPCKFFRGGYLFSTLALELWASGCNINDIEKMASLLLEQIKEVI